MVASVECGAVYSGGHTVTENEPEWERERESNTAGPEQQNRVNRQNHESEPAEWQSQSGQHSSIWCSTRRQHTEDRQTEQLKVRERERERERENRSELN